jgi:hypothetical protein
MLINNKKMYIYINGILFKNTDGSDYINNFNTNNNFYTIKLNEQLYYTTVLIYKLSSSFIISNFDNNILYPYPYYYNIDNNANIIFNLDTLSNIYNGQLINNITTNNILTIDSNYKLIPLYNSNIILNNLNVLDNCTMNNVLTNYFTRNLLITLVLREFSV